MKYLNLIFIFSIILLFISCDKSTQSGEYIEAGIDIYIQNSDGDNLLGKTYLEQEMRLFYLNNGNIEAVYNPNMDNPRGLEFIDIKGNTALSVFTNLNETDVYTITYLSLNEFDMDTIKAHYNRSENSIMLDTVWYNGKRMLPDNFLGPTLGFKIVK